MARLDGLSLRDLFARAASTDPSPGGGAVTALCGRLGIALMLKALRISLRRSEAADAWSAEDAALSELAEQLAADADADDAAFEAYVAAARLPRESEAERGARDAALKAAAIGATEAALASLDHARAAFAASRRIEAAIKPSIRADLVAGRELLKVVRVVAIENAEANLAALRDPARREPLAERLAALAEPSGFA
jgi:formiminotetrahydrofolate cyclodeaminase